LIGDRFELTVGAPAHGGHCVARHEGMVVFVRHALPGERVMAEVTEEHRGYLRADAVDVLEPSTERVVAPCPYAHPDGCGGCDLQHASPTAQLDWKTAVVREQLRRLAGLDWDGSVEPVAPSFGWRTRIRYHVDAADRPGLLKHRSNEVVPIDRCLIADPSIQALPILGRPAKADAIDVVAVRGKAQIVEGQRITERAMGRDFDLAASAFWQVHPAAAETLADSVLEMLAPQRGETALDLYGGAGLFAAGTGRPRLLGDHGRGVRGRVGGGDAKPARPRCVDHRVDRREGALARKRHRRARPTAHGRGSASSAQDRRCRATGDRLCRL
jgi:tRNA/tmRNA/rRNA uracil-C5-methylase (TrmA/RlmC/RlmD family)